MDKGEGCGVHLMELRGKQVNKVPLSLPRLSLSHNIIWAASKAVWPAGQGR